jgi:hypothetical protein
MSELQKDITTLNKAMTKLISDFERSHEDLAIHSIDIYRACHKSMSDVTINRTSFGHISLGIGVNV